MNTINIKEQLIHTTKEIPFEISVQNIRKTMPHFHSTSLELVYCLCGSVTVSASHQTIVLNAGDIFTLDFNDIHYIYSDEDNMTLIFNLDLTMLSTPWEDLKYHFFTCESCHCYPYQQKPMEQVKDIILSLAYSYFHGVSEDHAKGALKAVDNLIDIFIKYFCWLNYENYDEYINENFYDRYYSIQGYCIEHFREKITISQLAEMEHISENYLSQFMQKTAFYSYSQMINYIRCYEAEHLLLLTDMSNYQISYSCGFSDPKYFYKAFREWWGMTPSELRKKYKNYTQGSPEFTILEGKDACSFLREYIALHHIEKVFR